MVLWFTEGTWAQTVSDPLPNTGLRAVHIVFSLLALKKILYLNVRHVDPLYHVTNMRCEGQSAAVGLFRRS
jgi:hypothetical protein